MNQGNTLDQNTYDKGREIRAAVLGEAYVNAATAGADDFNKPFQDLVTEYCWGAVWGREVFMQVAVYAGVPAAVDSFRIARQTFAELDQD